jgi:transmembrane sensor
MNTSNQGYDPITEEQASLWAARLEGSSLSAADRVALDAWLAEKPAHRVLLSDYCQFSADLEQLLPPLVAAGSLTMPAREKSGLRWNLAWIVGGAFAVFAVVALNFWSEHRFETIATDIAQRQSITLEDGTRIELNARSRLQIQKGGAERHVRLLDGEAFFTVARDKTRPFIVETPAGSVRVTGTVFNVRSEAASEFEVTVVEGSVQVRPADADRDVPPVLLGAGDRFAAGAKQSLAAGELADTLAWRQGQVVFDETLLSVAVTRFAHYHGIAIKPAPGAGALKISGRHNLDDLDGFFSYLRDSIHVQVTAEADHSYRITLDPAP